MIQSLGFESLNEVNHFFRMEALVINIDLQVTSGRAVNSKILGTFVPNTKAKVCSHYSNQKRILESKFALKSYTYMLQVAAVTAFSSKDDGAFDRVSNPLIKLEINIVMRNEKEPTKVKLKAITNTIFFEIVLINHNIKVNLQVFVL